MLCKSNCCLVVLLLANLVHAEQIDQQRQKNWPQFRGPEATGVAPLADPPTTWDEKAGTNIKWKVAVPGQGSASPVVWGDRIFVLTAIATERKAENTEKSTDTRSGHPARLVAYAEQPPQGENPAQQPPANAAGGEQRGGGGGRGRGAGGGGGGRFGGGAPPTNFHQFVVMCLDRRTGETVWQKLACEVVPHEGHHETSSFASASPITDGQRVYACFGSRGIYCYDMDGNPLWSKDLGRMQTKLSFGEGATPALYGDTLVVQWDHEGPSFIVALDAKTGNEKWRIPREEQTTWSTPLVVQGGGRTQVITNGTNRIRSYDLKNGELIWECSGLGANPIPCPVTLDDVVFCMTGHRDPALLAIRLDAKGDITGTDKIVWQTNEGPPYIASPLLYNGLLYITKSRNAILSCVDPKTGDLVIDQKRLPQMETLYASPVGAAGRIYFSSREGKTVVIKQSRELEVLATNQLDETIDATPAIVGKEMYIRGEKHLYCIAEK